MKYDRPRGQDSRGLSIKGQETGLFLGTKPKAVEERLRSSQ